MSPIAWIPVRPGAAVCALAALVGQMKGSYPHVAKLAQAVYHDAASVVGAGCDDRFEFEFALDLLLDGLDRLR